MNKNVLPYLISYFLACLILFINFAFECNVAFYVLWLVPSVFCILAFIKIYKINKTAIKNGDTNFLWAFNDKYNKKTTNILIACKIAIMFSFVIINIIFMKNISITNMSILSLALLILLIVMKSYAGSYKYNYGVEYSSWEITMTKPQLILLYKSNVFFFTVSILPLIICSLYGNSIFKCVFSAVFFILSIVLGYVYPIIYDFKIKRRV